jgi:methylase of polypeptide subunit release factors
MDVALGASDLAREVDSLTQAYRAQARPGLALELFRALGWNTEERRLEPVGRLNGSEQFRLVVAGETTGMLVAGGPIDDGLVRGAANVAYNSGIDWTALTDFGTTQLVNARWYEEPALFSLNWQEYGAEIERLALLSPDSLISGHLDEEARRNTPAKVLQPVDRHLTGMLETWRRLLLNNSAGATDEQVHELVGRLLFIRSCEDRGILPADGLLQLRTMAGDGRSINTELRTKFSQLARDFEAELFVEERTSPPPFDEGILSQVISELYRPYPMLPQYKYDFAYLNVDVLGKVYERYVSTILDRVPRTGDQPRLFPSPEDEAEIQVRSRRRERGIYYTPPFIVNYLVQHTVEQLHPKLQQLPKVADISCGSGAFLTRAAERMAVRQPEDRTTGNVRRQAVGQVRGVDVDARAVTLARVNLWILASMGQPPRPLPELGASVTVADALTDPSVDALRGQFDVVVGNPPFRSSVELDDPYQERLRARYQSARARFDLAYVFAERALELVRPGGYIGLVLPNRLYTNSGARYLRDLLTREAVIEKVVDFSHQPAFAEGTSYVSLLIARRRPVKSHGDQSDDSVQVHRILELAEIPGLQLRRADLAGDGHHRDQWSEIFLSPQPSGRGPWIWSRSSAEERVALKLETDALPISSIVDVYQGVKTGDNRVFLFRPVASSTASGLWTVRNALGEQIEIEPDLLRPCARGTFIRKYSFAIADAPGDLEYVLYPHLGGRLLELYEIEASFPATFAYLKRHEERLRGRSTAGRGRPWHDVAWSRDEEWLEKPKILGRELMPQAEFALDASGQFIPVGGVALVPKERDSSLAVLLAIVNSSLMTWYLSRSSSLFQGGHLKAVPGILKRFRFPWAALVQEPELGARISSLAAGAAEARRLGLSSLAEQDEIDATIYHLIGLDEEEQAAISQRLNERPIPTEPEESPQWVEALESPEEVFRLVHVADTDTGRRRGLLLLRSVLSRMLTANTEPRRQQLLTLGILAADQVGRSEATFTQLAVLGDLVEAIQSGKNDVRTRDFERRLHAEGIDVMPSIAGASARVGVDSSDDEDTVELNLDLG